MTGRVVVGVDGSPHSDAALRWALELAERLGDTRVVAVFAWQLPLIGIPGAFDQDELEAQAKQYLTDLVDDLAPAATVPLERVVAHAEPTAALVEASQDADLLVLGTRGRSAFRGLLLGSVSQGCAAAASCPVVIVKLKAEGEGTADRDTTSDEA